jgi:hypothetical protein
MPFIFIGSFQRTGPHEHGDPLTGVEHIGGVTQVFFLRHDVRHARANPGMHGAVLVRWLDHRGRFLNVIGQDDARDRALDHRDADGSIDQVPHLLGSGRHLNVRSGDVFEQAEQIHFLLVAAAQGCARLLADNRDDGLVIQLRVVQTVEQMDGARAGRRQADTNLAGIFRVAACHERGHLLVPDLNEANGLPDSPVRQPLHDEVCDRFGHWFGVC